MSISPTIDSFGEHVIRRLLRCESCNSRTDTDGSSRVSRHSVRWRLFVGVLLMGGLAIPASAAPTVAPPAATPAYITVATPTTVIVTARIDDPTFVAGSANLLKVDAAGRTLATIGALRDDGLNGDAVAGDKNLTIRFIANEPTVALSYYRVSAAFKGVLQRVLSTTVVVTVLGQPSITATVTPSPNAAGWNNTPVTVHFICTQTGNGIVSCPADQVITADGANQTITGTTTDRAGKSATTSITLHIDRTPPVVTPAASPAANASGWNNGAVTVSFTATDPLSGVVPGSVTLPVILAADGSNLSVTGSAADRAGNVASATRSGINIDQVPPVLTVALSPSPEPSGFFGIPVTAHFTCNDSGSGIAACPAERLIDNEGLAQTISGLATDFAGNSASVTSAPFNIDLTPPTITVNLSPPANAAGFRQPPVLAHFTCTDSGAGIEFCPPDQLVSNDGLNQTVTGTARDRAGRTATVTSEPFNIGSAVPSISATVTPAPNENGWHRTPVTVHFTCSDLGSGIAGCPPDQVVSTEGFEQAIVGTATNNAGNQATATVHVSIDMTPPVVTLSPPTTSTTGTTVFTPSITLSGTATDTLSGIASATCNGAPATVGGDAFECVASLTPGMNTVQAEAIDLAGNSSLSSALTFIYTVVPIITLHSPAHLSYTNITPTTVTGTVNDPTATVTINSIAATVINGTFSAALPLAEGPNLITATATSASGAAGTATMTVTLDTTPPRVTITSPANGFVTTDSEASIAGIVNDIVVGTVNPEQATVSVNDAVAQVGNRTFLASSVPLVIGANAIQAVARDRVGNQSTTQITVIRQTPVAENRVQLLSGNNQTAPIGAPLAEPLVVALTNGVGNPVPDVPVIFKVTQNNGTLHAAGLDAPTVIATSDAQGRAQAQWTLGQRAGAGGNAVEAYAVGFEGTAVFMASGSQGPAGKVVIDAGNDQIGSIGLPLPKPLIAVIVDDGNNRLSGVPVTFTVEGGGGNFDGQSSLTVVSDPDGRVAARLTLGLQEGNANNVVTATFPNNQGFPASFTASGRAPGDPANTTISGVILDNSNIPIPGVIVRAVLTNELHSSLAFVAAAAAVPTDAEGQFTIPQAPVGFVKLFVDGSTAQLPGHYPSLEYDIVTVAGRANTVGQPIYLLPINTANQLCVTATTGGGTLTIPEAPGFSLTFGPGQVTFPGGSKQGCVSVTVVHSDKVPMVPGFGQQPRFIVTIQPSGAMFNPPAPITLPNVDGLAPRDVTEMYSFDHDIGSFVAIGTGVVSDDGMLIRSSKGVGVLKAGWHCGGNPASSGSVSCPAPPPPGCTTSFTAGSGGVSAAGASCPPPPPPPTPPACWNGQERAKHSMPYGVPPPKRSPCVSYCRFSCADDAAGESQCIAGCPAN